MMTTPSLTYCCPTAEMITIQKNVFISCFNMTLFIFVDLPTSKMPQVHNKFVNDTTFGRDSRYMTSLRFSDKTLRRVNVLNDLETRISSKKVNLFQSESAYKIRKMDRVKDRLEDNMNKRMAYKLVLKTNTFSAEADYNKALDKRYSFQAFSNDVRQMMKAMKPDLVRERRAKLLLKENRIRYDIILNQNRQRFNKLVPEKRTWIPRHLKAIYEEERRERERLEREKANVPVKVEDKSKRGLATLRRRIITIDSPVKTPVRDPPKIKTPALRTPNRTPSPVKTPSISKAPQHANTKRQGITMAMMKKQTSFLERQELTMSPTTAAANGNTVSEKDVEKTSENTSEKISEKQGDVQADISKKGLAKPVDVNNYESDTGSATSKDTYITKVQSRRGSVPKYTGKARKNSQPQLPPIDLRRTSRDVVSAASSVAKESEKPVKLPALKPMI